MADAVAKGARSPTMLAAELVRPGCVEMREVRVPRPAEGEIIVRVETALTCGTDIKTFQRGHPKIPLPTPMGHELAGIVAEVGPGVTALREGDRIACVPTAPCGECRLCRAGRESLCPEAVGRMVFGAFAEFVRVPAHIVDAGNAFVRPADMPAHVAAALEPLSCVVHGASRVRLEGASVAVIGDGPIALLFLQLARLRGAERILLLGRHDVRLAAARDLGADVSAVSLDDLRDAVLEWSDGTGADVVVECVGRPEAWEAAQRLAATGGIVLLYGGCAAGTRVSFDAYRLHYEEVDLIGAFHYGRPDVRDAFALLRDGRVRIDPLVTHVRPLARLDDALALVLSREAIKVAIEP
jgi:L-iditol 2-dehydrogenase